MNHFTIAKTFLLPTFNPEAEEMAKLDEFLLLLDNSGVASIIQKYIKNNSGLGGRPNSNYYRLFATILYGFAFYKNLSKKGMKINNKIFSPK